MRFLHAADLHIDSPLRGLDRFPGAPIEEIRTATRRAFSAVIDLALAENVDFMVLAGDVFDGNWPDIGTGLFFVAELERLARNGSAILVFVTLGNHDAASKLTSGLRWPKHVHRFDHAGPQTVTLADHDVTIHGQSFGKGAIAEDLAANFPQAHATRWNIGVLHTSLGGHASHETYAPTSLDVLRSKGYDAWCLGHVHERAVLHRNPLVLYPGNTQGRHINEPGERGCYIIEESQGVLRETFYSVDVLRWSHLEIDCSQAASHGDMLADIEQQIEALSIEHDRRFLCIRITLHGATALDQELRSGRDDLRGDLTNIALRSGAWLESLILKTAPPISIEALQARSDLFGDVFAAFEAARAPGELRERISEELRGLQDKIPSEVLAQYNTRIADGGALDDAIAEAKSLLVGYLGS